MRLSSPIYKLKRQAKLLTRNSNIKLHKALDQIAHTEGFNSWSHLASKYAEITPAKKVLDQLKTSDVVLIGARRGHGKTLLALELAALTLTKNRTSYVFTLEYNEMEVWDHLEKFGVAYKGNGTPIIVDASDNICSAHIIERISKEPKEALIVIDYLQLLDQKRNNPPLEEQLHALKEYASKSGAIIVLISQIDRTFDLSETSLPSINDVRLPNPVDLSLFDKRCFLHDGQIQIDVAA